MKPLPDIIATIELAPPEAGGRASAMPARWFGCVMVANGRNHDIRLRLTQPLNAGESRRVGIDFLDPDTVLSHVQIGTTFGLWEGGIVGQGLVEAIQTEPALS
jgi:hypothetical protein